jgi:hypothetical protein
MQLNNYEESYKYTVTNKSQINYQWQLKHGRDLIPYMTANIKNVEVKTITGVHKIL